MRWNLYLRAKMRKKLELLLERKAFLAVLLPLFNKKCLFAMRLTLTTSVAQPYQTVFAGFDANLFLRLAPPLVRVRLVRFDGCRVGDVVALELKPLGMPAQRWTSRITEFAETADEIYFVDESEGADLPFFLRTWRHKHRICRNGDGATIIDAIEYTAPLGLNYLLYPILWLQFAWRKPIYRRTFASK